MRTSPPLLLLLLAACGSGDDGDAFNRSSGSGDDTAETGDSGGDSGDSATDTSVWGTDPFGGGDTAMDNGGGGEDTVNAAWVRCEEDGARWTFHMELNYAARGVLVDVGKGTDGYEVWYLSVQDDARTLWETTLEGLSGHNCQETLDLQWTVEGATGWSVAYESQYTPP